MTLVGFSIRFLILVTLMGWLGALKQSVDLISSYQEGKAYTFRINILLPNAIEIIALYLSIGLDLAESIKRAATSMPEPMSSEFTLISRNLAMGMSVSETMNLFVERTHCKSGRTLTMVFQQANQFGNETASKLRQLASSLREKRVNTLERASKTAPIKLLFPMVLFIFPALLIVLFTPVFIRSGLFS